MEETDDTGILVNPESKDALSLEEVKAEVEEDINNDEE
jgi:hypothetical protein